MLFLSNGSFSLLNRLTGINTLLFLLSIALYTDIFISIFFKESIFLVKDNWHLTKVSLGDWIYYLLGISLLYGAIAPAILHLAKPLLKNRETNNKSLNDNAQRKIRLSEIQDFAITENNSSAYQYYLEQSTKLEQFRTEQKHSFVICTLIIVSLIAYHNGTPGDQSILSSTVTRLSEEGILIGIFRLIVAILGLTILANVWMTDDFHEITKLSPSKNSFEKRNEHRWLAELSTGLLDRTTMLDHLQKTINAISEFHPSTQNAKENIKYCENHALLIFDKGTNCYRLTAKGRFFEKYI